MGRYVADTKYICSIWPGKMERIQRFFGPTPQRKDGCVTFYELEPVKKGSKPFVLEVSDMFEHPVDILKSAEAGRKVYDMNPIPCEAIVRDLLNHWVGNLVGVPHGCLPGVMEIISGVPKQHELEQLKEQQASYMEYMFAEGERIARDEGVRHISPTHRLAAEYLGKPRNWSHPSKSTETVPCPACKTLIPSDAYICAACGTKVKALPSNLIARQSEPEVAEVAK